MLVRNLLTKIATIHWEWKRINDLVDTAQKVRSLLTDLIELLEDSCIRFVFEKRNVRWIDEVELIMENIILEKHSTNKMTPTQAPLKKNEKNVSNNLLDWKKQKIKPKLRIDDLVVTADERKFF